MEQQVNVPLSVSKINNNKWTLHPRDKEYLWDWSLYSWYLLKIWEKFLKSKTTQISTGLSVCCLARPSQAAIPFISRIPCSTYSVTFKVMDIYLLFKFFFRLLVLERRDGREKEGKKHQLVASCTHPDWGPYLQRRRVPWPGIKPATLWSVGQCPATYIYF